MKKNRHIAIVLAGGRGSRMNSAVPKQYIMLMDRPVLSYSLECMQNSSFIDDIILVCGRDDEEFCRHDIVNRYNFTKVCSVIPGGEERYDSVYNGLAEIERLAIADEYSYVYIHDGARPCIDEMLLAECRDNVQKYGACVPAVPVKDTIKIVDNDGFCVDTPPRSSLMAVQTPQCFRYKLALEAYKSMNDARKNGMDIRTITDDAMVAERFTGARVKLCRGSYTNIKITTPEDMDAAERIICSNLQKIEKI